MALYFFDVVNGSGTLVPDDEGLIFPEMADACHEALKTLCEIGKGPS